MSGMEEYDVVVVGGGVAGSVAARFAAKGVSRHCCLRSLRLLETSLVLEFSSNILRSLLVRKYRAKSFAETSYLKWR